MLGVIRRLASPEAMASSTLAITFLVYLTGTTVIVFFDSTGSPIPALAASATTSTVAFGLLVLCRAPLRRIPSATWRVGAIAAIVVLINLIRALFLAQLFEQLGFDLSVPTPSRVIVTSLLTLTAMIVIGELVYRRNRFQVAVTQLKAKSIELTIEHATFSERLQHSKAELSTTISNVLDPALSLAAAEFDPDAPGRTAVTSAAILQEILRVSVRPMIETLSLPMATSEKVTTQPSSLADDVNPRHQRTIDITESIRPVLSVVPLRIIGFPVFITTVGFVTASWVVLLLGLTWPILSLIRHLWPARYRILSARPAIALLTVCFATAFAIPMFLLYLLQPFIFQVDFSFYGWAFATAMFLFSIATAWFVSAVFITERYRHLAEQSLAEVNQQIELSNARMRQEIWFAQRNLTWVLHGPVQSALVSATIRLESGADLSVADRESLWSNIVRAYSLLKTSGPSIPDVSGFLTEIRTLWQDVCEVSFTDSSSMIEIISVDPVATSAVIEIVREAVGNAIRHGNATWVEVTILNRAMNLVGLVIVDNGSGVTASAVPGIGSQLFASLSYQWSRDSSPTGTTILADLTWSPAA